MDLRPDFFDARCFLALDGCFVPGDFAFDALAFDLPFLELALEETLAASSAFGSFRPDFFLAEARAVPLGFPFGRPVA